MKQISIPNNGFRGTYSVLSEGSLLNLGAFGIIHWDIHTYRVPSSMEYWSLSC